MLGTGNSDTGCAVLRPTDEQLNKMPCCCTENRKTLNSRWWASLRLLRRAVQCVFFTSQSYVVESQLCKFLELSSRTSPQKMILGRKRAHTVADSWCNNKTIGREKSCGQGARPHSWCKKKIRPLTVGYACGLCASVLIWKTPPVLVPRKKAKYTVSIQKDPPVRVFGGERACQ